MQYRQPCIVSLFIIAASVGILSATPATNLNNVIAYPNPFKPSVSAAKDVTFAPVTSGALRLKIFKLSGELVYDGELDGDSGSIHWNVKDNNGNPAASGMYIYFISDQAGHTTKGKVAVIK